MIFKRLLLTAIVSLCATQVGLAAFVPTDISGLSAWLRSDMGVATSGSNVTQWNDLSGNGNNATMGISPVLINGGANYGGASVVNFANNGVAHLNLPDTATLGMQNSDYEIFVVASTPSNAIQFLTAGGFTTGVGSYETHLNGAAGLRGIPVNPNYRDVGAISQYSNNLPNIFSMRVDGNVAYSRANGVDSAPLGPGQNSLNTLLTLGVRGNASLGFAGSMAEVLVFDRALTSAERSQVEAYLQQQWQPFRLASIGAPPTVPGAPDNIARNPQATPFAKDVIPGYPTIHNIAHLTDGNYGNSFSWIGNSNPSFAGVSLGDEFVVTGIAFGRDSLGQFADRAAGTYLIQYTDVLDPDALTPDGDWTTLAELIIQADDPNRALRHLYEIDPVVATGIRIVTPDGAAIDELEVFGFLVPEPGSFAVWTLIGLGCWVARRRRVSQK